MAVLFGLGAAGAYGAADFIGGLVTRRAGALTVVWWSQLIGFGLLALALPVAAGAPPSPEAFLWGGGSGLAGGAGVILLYRGLAIGRMSVVAPITAVGAAIVPVLAGIGFGERPSGPALVGVAVAMLAIVAVSSAPAHALPAPGVTPEPDEVPGARFADRPGLAEAVGAGIAFGLFFVLLERSGLETGLWPLVGVRLGSLTLVTTAALVRRRRLVPPAGTWPGIAAAGALDMLANVLYLLGTRSGLLSLVAVLTSLYPAATVLLARVVLSERLSRLQLAGLGLAGGGIVLIGFG